LKAHKCDQKNSDDKDDVDSDDDDDLVEVVPIASPNPAAPQNPAPHPIQTEREMLNFIVQEYFLTHGHNLAAASFITDANQV